MFQRFRRRSAFKPHTHPVMILGNAQRRIFTGRAAGQSWAIEHGLASLGADEILEIQLAPEVMAVSTSFWIGLLKSRTLPDDTLAAFLGRHRLTMNGLNRDVLMSAVQRLMMEEGFKRRLSWWSRLRNTFNRNAYAR